HVLRRPLDRRYDVADAGEVEDVSCALEQGLAGLERANVALLEREIAVGLVLGEVLLAPPHQAVDDAHRHAALEQQVDHVAADKAGATGNHGNWLVAHAACNAFSLRTL